MPGVRVVTDSACDLTEDLTSKHGITVVPLTIRFGEEALLDRVELSPSEFWSRCKAAPQLPETSAPAPGAFKDAFEEAASTGYDGVVCITLSSDLSATYQAASAAADLVGGLAVRVVDSRFVTMGQGLLALAAAEAANGGADLDNVVRAIEEALPRTRVYGLIGTLDHLQRGGRIGAARAMLGSMLSIKPVIEVRQGIVDEESKQRTRSRALDYLAAKVIADGPLERLAICDGDADDVDAFMDKVAQVEVRSQILKVDLGPVVGTHTGPATIGVCYQRAPGTRPLDD